MHAPERMREVAPTIYARVRQFIADRPELHPINNIRPSLVLGTAKQQIPVGGVVTLGHYYMPEGAATVLTNYLSPGLQRFKVVRNLRTMSNVLNAAQLGMSAFHAGFTSMDAIVSTWSLGLRNLSEGKIMRGASRIGMAPLAPVANYFTGKAIQNEMLRPGSSTVSVFGLRYRLSPADKRRLRITRSWPCNRGCVQPLIRSGKIRSRETCCAPGTRAASAATPALYRVAVCDLRATHAADSGDAGASPEAWSLRRSGAGGDGSN